MAQFLAPEIIKRKRDGHELQAEEIRFMVDGFVAGSVPDYQMSAWLMAVLFKGMTDAGNVDVNRHHDAIGPRA
jgi:pyrimidine-nucleoside phosphorylase